MFQSKKK